MFYELLGCYGCFEQKIIGPERKTSLTVFPFIQIGKDDDLRFIEPGIRPDALQSIEPIHIRHHEIQDDKIRDNGSFENEFYRFLAIRGEVHIVSFQFQFISIHFRKEHIILYDQNGFFHKYLKKRDIRSKYNLIIKQFKEIG